MAEATQKNPNSTTSYPISYIIGLVVAIIVFVPSLLIASKHQLNGFQLTVFRDLNNLSNSFKYPALILTEGLGAGYAIAVCIVIPALYKRFKLAWRFLVTAGGAGVVMLIAKNIAQEPRPVTLLHGHLHERAVEVGLNRFPSGHETMAVALSLTLWQVIPKRWRWLCVLWIIVVGVSRIYVGDHTPNDIIGGFCVGLGSICVVRLLPKKFARKVFLGADNLLEKGLPANLKKLSVFSKL